ncbi:MAG: PilW family protein [Candidatus Thiodiazotropha sp. (ex Ctena orbiculata)]|uniref:PilW family protein n=1 Tax=Candidatus Thiodiazotropha taylori TaxID=2792791 RepID=A0A944QSR3_9GAMM|nr:PilW family protein [Candidatus Thiodiazotropha taylori]MBV2136452.1 PilW family protein [Candidatus Thiodiazotropha taylori]
MYRSNNHQTGFSIVSLMIASAIGIFIIGGAGKVYVDSKNTFSARTAVAAATESYRFAFQDMRRYLVMAGRGVATSDDGADSYSGTDNGLRTFPAIDGIPDGIASGDETVSSPWSPDPEDSSVVAVRYASGPAPCGLADNTLAAGTVTVRFLVDSDGDLICQAYQGGVQIIAQPMVSGVAQMRALYGIDTDADGVANQYLTANQVGNTRWVNVVAIRIGIVVKSGDEAELPSVFRPEDPETLDLLGAEFTAPDSNHVYRSATTTISLRNLHHINRQVSDI